MITTLQLSVPAAGKPVFAGVVASLTHYGFRVYRATPTETKRGLAVLAVTECAGDVEESLKELGAILPVGNVVEVQRDPLFN